MAPSLQAVSLYSLLQVYMYTDYNGTNAHNQIE